MNHQSHLVRPLRRMDSDIQKTQRQLKKIKYPVLAIQPASQLNVRINKFENPKLRKKLLEKLCNQKKLNAYRMIRGDGNCFFRALAYSYLSNAKNLSDFKQTFLMLQDVDLTVCSVQSIPKQFKPYYNDKILKQVLQNTWSIDVNNCSLTCKDNQRRIISRLFRKNPYLDFILILYFRSVCLKGYKKYKDQMRQFMKGTQQKQIKTYGAQSQGVILDICSRYMKICIDIFMVEQENLIYLQKQPNSLNGSIDVSLLLYGDHYDIVERIDQQKLREEAQDTNIQQDEFYSEINLFLVEGQCLECGDKQVYEENFLCPKCFEISRNQLLNTCKTERFITGTCSSCGKKDKKLLQAVKMCESCVQRQSEIEKSPKKKSNYDCKVCHTELSYQNQQCPRCQTTHDQGYCLDCKRRRIIQIQTKLCKQCKQNQSRIFKRVQQKKNKCKDCQFPLDSQHHKIKCETNLTKARIGMKRTQAIGQPNQYKDKTCIHCQEFKLDQKLIDNRCQRCYLDIKKHRERINPNLSQVNPPSVNNNASYFQQNPNKSSILGSGMNQIAQKCNKCGKVSYTYKFKNGLCLSCSNFHSRSPYF